MYCQQFTLKYIKLLTKSFRPNQFYHRAGLISLHHFECVSNNNLIVPSFLQQALFTGLLNQGAKVPLEKKLSSWKNVLDKVKNYWTQ